MEPNKVRTINMPFEIMTELSKVFATEEDFEEYKETALAFSNQPYNMEDFGHKYYIYFYDQEPLCILKKIKTFEHKDVILGIGNVVTHKSERNKKEFMYVYPQIELDILAISEIYYKNSYQDRKKRKIMMVDDEETMLLYKTIIDLSKDNG